MMTRNQVSGVVKRFGVLPIMVLGFGVSTPAAGQDDGDTNDATEIDEIIVTARRREESIQDVPISITVLDQQTLTNRNVVTASDLATYAPSLAADARFGPDNSSFAIRGFTQEFRTPPSVGVYFAEVVGPRGPGSIPGGDGAGPGNFFDLQNVQILNGPQGTLFGRSTTGGAVLIVPQKPTYDLEGYLEASAGNYDMQHLQGVLNLPMGSRLRARLGVDYQQRDGYLENQSELSVSRFGDVDYVAARASLVADLTDSIENYTILSYTDSENNGTFSKLIACNSAPSPEAALFAGLCAPSLLQQGNGFYNTLAQYPDPKSEIKRFQGINTTTWMATDTFTVKNIFSYASLEQETLTDVFGLNFVVPFPGGALPLVFAEASTYPGRSAVEQESFVEELQFQGRMLDARLTWQGGFYVEKSDGNPGSGAQGRNAVFCPAPPTDNPTNNACLDVMRQIVAAGLGIPAEFLPPIGSIQSSLTNTEYENKAAYFQATYGITDQLKVTGGIRYTEDDSEGDSNVVLYSFPANAVGPMTGSRCLYTTASLADDCFKDIRQKSNATTWLLGLDYLPTEQVLLYGKYTRGYRAGGVSPLSGEGFQSYEPEEVDAYEVGAKTQFDGFIAGTFNVAAFYNKLRDQQLQVGLRGIGVATAAGITNGGESMVQGVEVQSTIQPFKGFTFELAYTYLDTELKEVQEATLPPGSPYQQIGFTARQGDPLPYSPKNRLAASIRYELPLSKNVGEVSLGASWIYTDKIQYVTPTDSPFGVVDAYDVLNLTLAWRGIAGSPVDASLFATNVTEEEYLTWIGGLYNDAGFDVAQVGQPRMYGLRLRYHFGGK